MKSIYAVLLVVIVAIASSDAFFFKKRVQVQASAEIDETCERKASQGDCDFYNCFYTRHQCQEYLMGHAHDLCMKLEEKKPQFTPQGQRWLTNNTKCIMENLIPLYNSGELNCEDLADAGYNFYLECSLSGKPSVCDIIWRNMEHFMAVTDMKSLRDANHAFKTMARCGLQSLQRFLRYLTERQIGIPFAT